MPLLDLILKRMDFSFLGWNDVYLEAGYYY